MIFYMFLHILTLGVCGHIYDTTVLGRLRGGHRDEEGSLSKAETCRTRGAQERHAKGRPHSRLLPQGRTTTSNNYVYHYFYPSHTSVSNHHI